MVKHTNSRKPGFRKVRITFRPAHPAQGPDGVFGRLRPRQRTLRTGVCGRVCGKGGVGGGVGRGLVWVSVQAPVRSARENVVRN